MSVYYLDNTYSNFNLNFDPNFNYKVIVNTFNGTADGLSATYTSNNVTSNVLVSGKSFIDNALGIRSSIENVKFVENQKNVLFVNDVIK